MMTSARWPILISLLCTLAFRNLEKTRTKVNNGKAPMMSDAVQPTSCGHKRRTVQNGTVKKWKFASDRMVIRPERREFVIRKRHKEWNTAQLRRLLSVVLHFDQLIHAFLCFKSQPWILCHKALTPDLFRFFNWGHDIYCLLIRTACSIPWITAHGTQAWFKRKWHHIHLLSSVNITMRLAAWYSEWVLCSLDHAWNSFRGHQSSHSLLSELPEGGSA